jgi:hypothetical protein
LVVLLVLLLLLLFFGVGVAVGVAVFWFWCWCWCWSCCVCGVPAPHPARMITCSNLTRSFLQTSGSALRKDSGGLSSSPSPPLGKHPPLSKVLFPCLTHKNVLKSGHCLLLLCVLLPQHSTAVCCRITAAVCHHRRPMEVVERACVWPRCCVLCDSSCFVSQPLYFRYLREAVVACQQRSQERCSSLSDVPECWSSRLHARPVHVVSPSAWFECEPVIFCVLLNVVLLVECLLLLEVLLQSDLKVLRV